MHIPDEGSDAVRAFLHLVKETCADHGVQRYFGKHRRVRYGDIRCNGYFTEIPDPKLAVATGKPFDEWFRILVHEYAHLTQWADDAPAWKDQIIPNDVYALDVLLDWAKNGTALPADRVMDLIRVAREVERDCEERVLRLIVKHALPIDPVVHTQKANSYIFFYTAFGETRRWYDRAPYEVPEIWGAMPTKILDSYRYNMLPDGYLDAVRAHLFKT